MGWGRAFLSTLALFATVAALVTVGFWTTTL